jgi:RNA polymerase sigma factor (sigma-70 family)
VSHTTPPTLKRLLGAVEPPALDHAWSGFVEEYGRLILHVARSHGGSYDAVMDRYTYVLEQLRRDDHRRLRAYTADGRSKFTTWLVVVARRLCIDAARNRYGRKRGEGNDGKQQRQQLADLVGADVDVDLVPGDRPGPDDQLRAAELSRGLSMAITALHPSDRLLLRLRQGMTIGSADAGAGPAAESIT